MGMDAVTGRKMTAATKKSVNTLISVTSMSITLDVVTTIHMRAAVTITSIISMNISITKIIMKEAVAEETMIIIPRSEDDRIKLASHIV
jgi:hypothetical protein